MDGLAPLLVLKSDQKPGARIYLRREYSFYFEEMSVRGTTKIASFSLAIFV